MQKLGGSSKSPPFLLFSFALSSALLPHLLAPSSASFPLPPTSTPVPPLRACTCAHPRALAHTRASADFRFLPSPFTALSQLTVYQHTRGEHLPHTIPFTSPSPSLSRFSPTGYGKVPLFPTLPPYFSRHSPYLANCKISHRAGEGIFLKAFTPYALIYCALRPTGEEVKKKNENHLTRAREGNPKNTPATPCRLSPRPNIRLPHVAVTFFFLSYSFPLLLHVAQSRCGEERKCMYALTLHNVGHAHGFLTQNTTKGQFLRHNNMISLQFTWIYIYIYLCISSKSSSP